MTLHFFQPHQADQMEFGLGWRKSFVLFPKPKLKAEFSVDSPGCPKRSAAYLQDCSRKLALGSVNALISLDATTSIVYNGVCSSI